MDLEFLLDIKCTSDNTMDVTSNHFTLDERFPDIGPVGHPQLMMDYDNGVNPEEDKVCCPVPLHSCAAGRLPFPLLLFFLTPAFLLARPSFIIGGGHLAV